MRLNERINQNTKNEVFNFMNKFPRAISNYTRTQNSALYKSPSWYSKPAGTEFQMYTGKFYKINYNKLSGLN